MKRDMEVARAEQAAAAAAGLWQLRDLVAGEELKLAVGPHKAKDDEETMFPSQYGSRRRNGARRARRSISFWMLDPVDSDLFIDEVLAAMPAGASRIGLDIGGGTGTFTARMAERGGVTVATTSMDFDAPFDSFIASRGLVPMHVSVARRLPFFDGTLDVVHSMHVLSNWIPDAALELALFDVYRVLRPGGVFWLDHFFCLGTHLDDTYVPMFDRIGFKKLRWNAGRKLDRGIDMDEWYVSALLEKPRRRS
ncbi:hypothetical protein EJB05_10173, partial [Eragrostis curvula]